MDLPCGPGGEPRFDLVAAGTAGWRPEPATHAHHRVGDASPWQDRRHGRSSQCPAALLRSQQHHFEQPHRISPDGVARALDKHGITGEHEEFWLIAASARASSKVHGASALSPTGSLSNRYPAPRRGFPCGASEHNTAFADMRARRVATRHGVLTLSTRSVFGLPLSCQPPAQAQATPRQEGTSTTSPPL